MDSISEYNEEQFQMLCLAITDTSSGICLFQCDDTKEQVSIARHVQNSISKSSVVIDMANLGIDEIPDEIGKVRDLLIGNETVQVVLICNLQLCGEAVGDEKYIEKINYMRDQMMAMKKVWVFGMSRYFAIMLSRKARDLYSCILNHFDFKEERETFLEFSEIELSGDKKISLMKFKELQERIQRKAVDNVGIEVLLQAITEWNKIYECCNSDINQWVKHIVKKVDNYMRQLEFRPTDCIAYLQVALAWLHFENGEQAVETAKFIEEKAAKLLPKNGKDMSDIYKKVGSIYLYLKQYENAEKYCEMSLSYYSAHVEVKSWDKVEIMHLSARIKTFRGECEEAISELEGLIHDISDNYGARYFYLIPLWNNLGKVYVQMHQYSEALKCLQNAFELFQYNKEYVGWRYELARNIAIVYKLLGNTKKGIDILLEAEKIAERLDSSFESRKRQQDIFTLLEKYLREDSQDDMADEYALKLRQLTIMENTFRKP